jgi:hypothetical protein
MAEEQKVGDVFRNADGGIIATLVDIIKYCENVPYWIKTATDQIEKKKMDDNEARVFIQHIDLLLKDICAHVPKGTHEHIDQAVELMAGLMNVYAHAHLLVTRTTE